MRGRAARDRRLPCSSSRGEAGAGMEESSVSILLLVSPSRDGVLGIVSSFPLFDFVYFYLFFIYIFAVCFPLWVNFLYEVLMF